MEDQFCKDCKYGRRSWTNPENTDLYCGGISSENYGETMAETKSCERWEKNDREIHE